MFATIMFVFLCYLVFVLMSHCNRGGRLTLQMGLHLSGGRHSVVTAHLEVSQLIDLKGTVQKKTKVYSRGIWGCPSRLPPPRPRPLPAWS